ncbi:hypothetical protein AAFF_G00041720 [Aldrovandia affinis]|uniref:ERC protein 2 n=1 Tax=Aldrovandia affinis TaxID=143900 RepID=A0AAD7S2L7_9TELE|nr:hypothetical protein AAFF_G00041720 [Aldrovandia affinis]
MQIHIKQCSLLWYASRPSRTCLSSASELLNEACKTLTFKISHNEVSFDSSDNLKVTPVHGLDRSEAVFLTQGRIQDWAGHFSPSPLTLSNLIRPSGEPQSDHSSASTACRAAPLRRSASGAASHAQPLIAVNVCVPPALSNPLTFILPSLHLRPQCERSRRAGHLQLTIQALQDELRTQRDLNHLLQQEGARGAAEHYTIELTEENFRRLQAEHDRQAKELFLLRKTLEEMELRIETQKQTLTARDESIKKLLEMLQSQGLPPKGMEDEGERSRRVAEAESQVGHLEVILDQKEKENLHLREELHRRNQLQQDPAKTKALQTVIEMKNTAPPFCFDPDVIWQDTKIASLERNIRDLEDEIQMLKTNGLLSTEDREEEMKQMEVYKSHSKFMKNKIDQLKQELSKKESELLALQTKLETLTNQNSDCKQHIEVLKESLTAKEQRAAILQTEVDALRLRLEEKESFLNKKTKQLQDLTEEKGTLAGEIRDMKDMLEVKERKINVLQKKIENLQEQLRDKDKQLTNLKDRVKSLQTDSSNTDTALATLEEALSEKERIIERLKEQREREDRERLEESETYKKENKDLKEKVNTLQAELTEKESSLIDLKEHASSLASSGLKKDSKLKTLEIAIEQKKEECSKLETQLQKAHEAEEVARTNPELNDKVKHLEKEVAYYKDESGKSRAEVDRLLEILREVETEKNDKDKKIAELERQAKDPSKKATNVKHNQPVEKKPGLTDGGQHVQLEELMGALEKTRQELDATKQRLSSTQQSLSERDGHLTNLRQERRKQLEEILEMKQQALLAAISEKDANIALLELSGSKKKKSQEEVAALKREKDRLMHQLKQQTQSRMKLIADNYDDDHHPPHHLHHPHHPHPQHPQHVQHPAHPHPQHPPQPQHPPHPQHPQHPPQPPTHTTVAPPAAPMPTTVRLLTRTTRRAFGPNRFREPKLQFCSEGSADRPQAKKAIKLYPGAAAYGNARVANALSPRFFFLIRLAFLVTSCAAANPGALFLVSRSGTVPATGTLMRGQKAARPARFAVGDDGGSQHAPEKPRSVTVCLGLGLPACLPLSDAKQPRMCGDYS